MIIVANKRTFKPRDRDQVFYVGRPSALGNPFGSARRTQAQFKTGDRDESIRKYRVWLPEHRRDTAVSEMLLKIYQAALREDRVVLLCWCAPLSCHADVIKKLIEDSIALQEA